MDLDALTARLCAFADAMDASETPIETGIPGFTLVRSRQPTPIEPTLYSPLLCVVLQGRKETMLGAEPVEFGAGESLVVSMDLPTSSRITEASEGRPYVGLALEIDRGLVRDLQAEIDEARLPAITAGVVASGVADPGLLEAMGRLFDLVDRPRERGVLLPLLRREIHFRMVLAGHAAMLRRLAWQDSHASRVARAIAHIRREFPRTSSVAELARVAGMGASSFHEHFKAITRTTPLQFQKDLRLLEARQRLQSGRPPVATVAYDVGYQSPAQFSREYARKFGRPPSTDRGARRAGSGPAGAR